MNNSDHAGTQFFVSSHIKTHKPIQLSTSNRVKSGLNALFEPRSLHELP